MKKQLVLTITLVLIVVILTGCGTPATTIPSPLPPATSIPQPTPKPTDARLALKPCTVGGFSRTAQCGFLHVPEDRSNPNSRMLDLGIVVVPAREANPEPDPLFYIAGGPGAAATMSGFINNADVIFKEINNRRAIIFLDQRGTNDKHRLTCKWPSFAIADAPQQQVNDWLNGCLSTQGGDPRFYTTAEAMRDLDEARTTLGIEKINLYGLSYGVTAIQAYMRMFPEHVRAAVLDHGTALDHPFTTVRPRAIQSALEQVFTYCEKDEKCQSAYPNIRGEWQAILDRLAKGPVITSFTLPGETKPYQVSLEDLASSILNLLLSSGTYATIPTLIHTFATIEDWTPLVEKTYKEQGSTSASENNMLFMAYTIDCFEPWWGYDAKRIDQLNQGSFYRGVEVKGAQQTEKICAALPKPDPSLLYPPGNLSSLRPLIINSLLDPQNPPSNMDLALKEFPQSFKVVESTEGHDTSPSGCRWDIIAQYIQNASTEGLDTSCMTNEKPSFMIGN